MPDTTPADRRPIAARSLPVFIRASERLAARNASPNAISVAGAVAAVAAGLCLAAVPDAGPLPGRLLWLAAAVLVPLRLLANMLDGMVAIRRGVASPVGELFNEVPDRVSDTAVLCGLGVAAGWPALGLAAALAAMATAYVRATGKAAGGPSDFRGPMAKQQRMALVVALALACAALPAAWTRAWPEAALWILVVGATATALRRLAFIAAALRRRA